MASDPIIEGETVHFTVVSVTLFLLMIGAIANHHREWWGDAGIARHAASPQRANLAHQHWAQLAPED